MNNENNTTQKSNSAKKEEETLVFWKENNIFQKSLAKKSPKGEFIFYEGPPTANGRPGIHHLESRAFKDAIPRYKTMRGYRVRRRAGWDTHGLPVELEVEKQLGFTGKSDVEKYGIAEFNKKCRESVLTYISEWSQFTDRIGYWVNQDDAYYTYNPTYMESLWNIFKKVSDDGLLYKDYKVVPWCPRCQTGLSSHELAQGYEDVTDLSVTVKFELVDEPKVFLLAWTTTPWTLPGNVALAVHTDVSYGQYVKDDERVIVAEKLSEQLGEGWTLEKKYFGKDLIGKKYREVYPYLVQNLDGEEVAKREKAFQVYSADFVTTEDGTGIVHTAVLYGQDDFELGTTEGLPKVHLVNPDGKFKEGMDFLSGRFVRDEDVAIDIIKDLAHRGLLFSKQKYTHSYPFCWRCKTALIYYARDSWFIKMDTKREELIAENKKVNWEPSHIRDGRMGDWLLNVRDWAVSRERYWATPLPVWESEDSKERVVIGSVEELKQRVKKSGNTYILMRHGQAMSNAQDIASTMAEKENHLTDLGREQAEKSGEQLKTEGVDIIITTPILRAQETANIVADAIGFKKEDILVDARMREIDVGEFEGKSNKEFHTFFGYSYEAMFKKRPEGGENLVDVRLRVGEFLYDLEQKYQNKKILIVAHEYPIWLAEAVAKGVDEKEIIAMKLPRPEYYKNAEWKTLDFVPLPHNDNYELDLHRPYIDAVELVSDTGTLLKRVESVLDVWFDSGGMPFAQDHYPFENKEWVERNGYPAHFISEAIDQTRGWFYTLLALGVLMGKGVPYKNVICLGHLLDAEGRKMSKSKGNVINPWEAMDTWGVDTIRFWMYSVSAPGDSKSFDEKTVRDVSRTLSWLENSVKFYTLSKDATPTKGREEPIDTWMKVQTRETVEKVTEAIDAYDVTGATRTLADLFEDISQWYVRRIRDRVREGDEVALSTLRDTLHTASLLLAPFAPFLAEQVFQGVRYDTDAESVHLMEWPSFKKPLLSVLFSGKKESVLLADMKVVRDTISSALKFRQQANLKVRQPLSSVTLKSEYLKGKTQFLELIQEEVNIKEVLFDPSLEEALRLDTTITPELQEEGNAREVVRFIQDLRKKANLEPKDTITITYSGDDAGVAILENHWESIQKATNVSEKKEGEGDLVPVEGATLSLAIQYAP
ncbi:isoleucine--tRNA ligase [Candidatus Kaiserbacteria bacterium CG10_big_fil_rev_8_21_14_0_10_45_20]|uniref:isoleucine--tRNA ligase n=1 Tax=Candidatus Kaiserbacteria bacterium CG10_big_fil_rev_8_21_14_0_10_45_20 TaxID=1974607 RepID=A0A2H0UF52_9BACT|nr:MAG: isoleucine--tRNA ligase [Candidatus Kaiserbacteria bacterium CG10_big_fil_rev_8_21_14_0_10_45_20]